MEEQLAIEIYNSLFELGAIKNSELYNIQPEENHGYDDSIKAIKDVLNKVGVGKQFSVGYSAVREYQKRIQKDFGETANVFVHKYFDDLRTVDKNGTSIGLHIITKSYIKKRMELMRLKLIEDFVLNVLPYASEFSKEKCQNIFDITKYWTPREIGSKVKHKNLYNTRFMGKTKDLDCYIFSNGAYWRPGGRGYTYNQAEAGIYNMDEALKIGSRLGPEKSIEYHILKPL